MHFDRITLFFCHYDICIVEAQLNGIFEMFFSTHFCQYVDFDNFFGFKLPFNCASEVD